MTGLEQEPEKHLIDTVRFFRDPETFAALESEVIPKLFEGKGSDGQVRVWVPGCGTGEEVWSLAMLLLERAGGVEPPPQVQIFATDVDTQALATARQGRYGGPIAEQVAPERLARFFVENGNTWQVARAMREICLFASHDFVTDPPFSRLDLIFWRNLQPDLQRQLIPLCHFALRAGGYLLLEPSEGMAAYPHLFRTVHQQPRIFQATGPVQRPPYSFPLPQRSPLAVRRPAAAPPAQDKTTIQRLETELRSTRDHLQSVQEELESSNEELVATNEELARANNELQQKVEELTRAEQHRARLAAIVESSHDAILGKTLEGIVVSWNAGAERLYGYTAEEAIGCDISFLAPPERIGELEPIFAQLRRGERVKPFETVRVRKDGTRLDILLTVSPILDGSGRIAEASAIAHDITAQKRTEAALHEEARRKDEFLAMLGHELRNPLATIRNGLAILEQPGVPSDKAELARQTLARQVQHLTRLVDDLLDVSRISRGTILLQTERIDLVALVRTAVEDHRAAAAGAGERLEIDLPDRPLRVAGDPIRLAQCVGNLLHNAVKFTGPGGRIDVAVRAEGGQAIVSVRDTGVGVDPATLARLFEPFNQADNGIDRSRGGLGLGLALVKRLVELHGGTATAHSEGLGRGTRVEIHLPLLSETGEEEPAPAPAGAVEDRRARRCLVIEDNADAAETLGMLLELSGHQVRVAHDGRQGLEEARRFLPEVVLCDIGLPGGLDGYEVARRMRQDPVLRGARLVALTGYGQEEDQRRAREAGFDVHLTKPADPERLEQLLAELP